MKISAEEAVLKSLKECYLDATRKGGLIEFTRKVRGMNNDFSGKTSIKPEDLVGLFSRTVWKSLKTKSGHVEFENLITGCHVEYSNHCTEIKAGAVLTILEAVQNHLNILNNQIFAYTISNWKVKPDYSEARERWLAL